MLSVLLIAFWGQSINGETDVIGPDPVTPSPFLVPDEPRPVVDLDTDAVTAAMLSGVTERDALPVMYSPGWCANCPGWAAFLNGMVEVRVVSQLPAGQPLAPAIQRADGAWWDWSQGVPTRESFQAWAGATNAVTAPQPVGSVELFGITEYLDLITGGELTGTLPVDPIELSDGFTLTTNGAAWRLKVGGTKSVTFDTPLPSVKWSAFRVDIEGVDLSGDKLTVRLKRLPDWTLSVK